MPKSLTKVQKHIVKKKGKNVVLHEGSRDTHRLQRAASRDDKLARLASAREKQNRPLLERVKHFRNLALAHESPTFTTVKIGSAISTYIQRHDEPLAELKASRRPGRPASTQETHWKAAQKAEELEFESGYWVPDLEDEDSVIRLKAWEGDWVGLNVVKFIRISKDGVRHESTFPPKGES